MSYQNTTKRWSDNWSGRGTAMLDRIENQGYSIKSNHTTAKEERTPESKLRILSRKFPQRPFYKSLVEQATNGKLSPKQVSCIEKDYFRCFERNYKFNRAGRFSR